MRSVSSSVTRLPFHDRGALTLQGWIENAFDADYRLADGYRTEGRGYTIGVRYSFD